MGADTATPRCCRSSRASASAPAGPAAQRGSAPRPPRSTGRSCTRSALRRWSSGGSPWPPRPPRCCRGSALVPLDRLRGDVALHAAAEGTDVARAGPRQLRAARRGPRLGPSLAGLCSHRVVQAEIGLCGAVAPPRLRVLGSLVVGPTEWNVETPCSAPAFALQAEEECAKGPDVKKKLSVVDPVCAELALGRWLSPDPHPQAAAFVNVLEAGWRLAGFGTATGTKEMYGTEDVSVEQLEHVRDGVEDVSAAAADADGDPLGGAAVGEADVKEQETGGG
ncbi:unnamed protein product [Prorocentrum cordatum]|uniref:Uncharacterized protein n=1 Tax=Prorocentrum cordatum TaxID=2364126 RepID=A0ABN9W3D2_9DINO|nr:unnamed protein product [Polarella glacialis]